MYLSHYEQRELTAMDRALSRDPTLRAVAGLFTEPALPSDRMRGRRPHRTGRAGRPSHSLPYPRRSVLLIVLVAVAGLACAAVAAPLNLPVVAAAGISLSICAGVLFIVAGRLESPVSRSRPAFAQRRSVSGPATPSDTKEL